MFIILEIKKTGFIYWKEGIYNVPTKEEWDKIIDVLEFSQPDKNRVMASKEIWNIHEEDTYIEIYDNNGVFDWAYGNKEEFLEGYDYDRFKSMLLDIGELLNGKFYVELL